MRVADDDASVAWELLRSSGVCAACLSTVTSVASRLMDGVRHTVGLLERGEGEPWTTIVADHGHDLGRLGVGVPLVPFAQERSAARGRRQAAQ